MSQDGAAAMCERFPVNQLMQRYGLVKSEIYRKMKHLGIRPHHIGIRSYITGNELELMDELRHFEGTLPEFLEQKQLRASQTNTVTSSDGSLISKSVSASVIHVHIVQPGPLEYLESLELASQKKWHLSTSQVAQLLSVPVSTVQQAGDRFSEAGFTFSRVGQGMVGEAAWKVSKQELTHAIENAPGGCVPRSCL